MNTYTITLQSAAGTERRNVIADASILALNIGLGMMLPLPYGPFTISCTPSKEIKPCA